MVRYSHKRTLCHAITRTEVVTRRGMHGKDCQRQDTRKSFLLVNLDGVLVTRPTLAGHPASQFLRMPRGVPQAKKDVGPALPAVLRLASGFAATPRWNSCSGHPTSPHHHPRGCWLDARRRNKCESQAAAPGSRPGAPVEAAALARSCPYLACSREPESLSKTRRPWR